MNELRVKISTLIAGQPRPYADSRWVYRVEMEYDPPTTKKTYTVRWEGANLLLWAAKFAWAFNGQMGRLYLDKSLRESLSQSLTHLPSWVWEGEWHQHRITTLRAVAPGVVEVTIIAEFTD